MKSVMGLFRHYEDAERAIENLDGQQFTQQNISVITRRRVMQNYLAEYDRLGGGATVGAIRGAALGGLTGLLVGLGATVIPGVGPVLMVGMVATAAGAATGSFVGLLLNIGVPRRLARVYQDGIRKGQILVAVHDETRVDEAGVILRDAGARYVHTYDEESDGQVEEPPSPRKRKRPRQPSSSPQVTGK